MLTAMMDVEHLVQEIRQLPVRDRLRLVEQVVHDLADVSSAEGPPAEPFPIGLFADDPDGVDDMMKTVMEMRRSSRLRDMGDDHAGEGSP
jgi:hypothetical protein